MRTSFIWYVTQGNNNQSIHADIFFKLLLFMITRYCNLKVKNSLCIFSSFIHMQGRRKKLERRVGSADLVGFCCEKKENIILAIKCDIFLFFLFILHSFIPFHFSFSFWKKKHYTFYTFLLWLDFLSTRKIIVLHLLTITIDNNSNNNNNYYYYYCHYSITDKEQPK